MSFCLNMIVRNEAERIERALRSVAPFIKNWVIADTGSTDNTKDRIHQFFKNAGIPGDIVDIPFNDFEQARNDALKYAAALLPVFGGADYFLLQDADMELVVNDPAAFLNTGHDCGLSYEMYQNAGAVQYTNSRLVNTMIDAKYKGVTHEFLDVTCSGRIPQSVAYFHDYADGSNRPDKFKRDIRLLKKGLSKEPDNARYMFYLACSYRDAHLPVKAATWFRRRIHAGGWDEEVWQSKVHLAHVLKDMGNHDGFVAGLLDAYSSRPTRAEPMYDLAKWYREQPDCQAAALACAEAVRHLAKPNDVLFVNDYVYSVGVKEEIGIVSSYVPGKLEQGRRVTDELSLMKTPYQSAVSCARANTYWYMRPLIESCPSFKWFPITFAPPNDLVPLNPSVCRFNNKMLVNVRAVNYEIDPSGHYVIKGTDGTANAENPIDTRNFVLEIADDMLPIGPALECYRPGNFPVEWALVTGFEDIRLIPRKGELWTSATVRQLETDGQCEQVQSRLIQGPAGTFEHSDIKRMLRQPRVTEKNWSPILWQNSDLFMDRPGHVINSDGITVVKHETPLAVDNISGSSQVIPWKDGWLAITHTAHALPNEPWKRYYFHRFIEYAADFRVLRVSLPWCFHDRVIEFCAGMCWGFDEETLVLSYGFKDCEARLATVSASDVERMLSGGWTYA